MTDYTNRLVDAEAIIKGQSEIMEALYSKTACELAQHLSVDDDSYVYIHSMEQYSRAKQFFYRMKRILETAPTVKAVSVTRCRECKNFRQNNENDPYCADRRGLDDPEPDDFCSYGEPKEEHGAQ